MRYQPAQGIRLAPVSAELLAISTLRQMLAYPDVESCAGSSELRAKKRSSESPGPRLAGASVAWHNAPCHDTVRYRQEGRPWPSRWWLAYGPWTCPQSWGRSPWSQFLPSPMARPYIRLVRDGRVAIPWNTFG